VAAAAVVPANQDVDKNQQWQFAHFNDFKDANSLATVPGKGYFVILRLYGPTEASTQQELEAPRILRGDEVLVISAQSDKTSKKSDSSDDLRVPRCSR